MVNTEYIRKEVRGDEKLQTKMQNNLESSLYAAKKDMARRQPIDLLSSAIDDIEKIDLGAVSKLKDSDRKEAIRIMKCIKDKVKYNE